MTTAIEEQLPKRLAELADGAPPTMPLDGIRTRLVERRRRRTVVRGTLLGFAVVGASVGLYSMHASRPADSSSAAGIARPLESALPQDNSVTSDSAPTTSTFPASTDVAPNAGGFSNATDWSRSAVAAAHSASGGLRIGADCDAGSGNEPPTGDSEFTTLRVVGRVYGDKCLVIAWGLAVNPNTSSSLDLPAPALAAVEDASRTGLTPLLLFDDMGNYVGSDIGAIADPPEVAIIQGTLPTSVDPRGNAFVLTESIEGPGQRMSVEAFKLLLEDGFYERNGYTFGLGPDSSDPQNTPDFVPTLDVNGSGTIIGFLPASLVYMVGISSDRIPVVGSDGSTVVGHLVISTTMDETSFGYPVQVVEERFEPSEG